MKKIFTIPFICLLGLLFLNNIQQTSSVFENHVSTFLKQYNYYMAILKRLALHINWELEVGSLSENTKKKAKLIASKVSRYMRRMDNAAERLYETVKKSSKKIPDDMRRQLMLINQVGTPKDLEHIIKTNKVLKIMSKIYSAARVCCISKNQFVDWNGVINGMVYE